jgi:energy-converting hydrogenase Eha subunit B
VGILVHGFGAITLYIVRIMEPFWFVTGLVVSLYLIKVQEAGKMREESLEEVSV